MRFADNFIWKTLIWLSTRIFVLYFVLIFLYNGLFDEELRRVKTLNYLMPRSGYLVKFMTREVELEKEALRKEVRYYKKVSQYMPDSPAAYSVLGFCYYYLGKEKKAVVSYEQAISLAPKQFWNYYNSGIIYFKNKEYAKALSLFEKAAVINSTQALQSLYATKTYQGLIAKSGISLDVMRDVRLTEGYRNAYLMLAVTNYYLSDFPGMLKASLLAMTGNFQGEEIFLYCAGVALYEMKKYQGAGVYFQKAIARNPRDVQAQYYFGLTLRALGKEELSERFLNQSRLLGGGKEGVAALEKDLFLRLF
ncbi:MAG: tetratricopeptide repeat protein [Candidatus Omnitrophica bacterium]|nr:tetratricopeptide repeat protein [Candidatus Omnitrophota bacterium]